MMSVAELHVVEAYEKDMLSKVLTVERSAPLGCVRAKMHCAKDLIGLR
jgi:hypothetical protein